MKLNHVRPRMSCFHNSYFGASGASGLWADLSTDKSAIGITLVVVQNDDALVGDVVRFTITPPLRFAIGRYSNGAGAPRLSGEPTGLL